MRSINRNIVECKGILLDRKSVHNRCINRNIVECKDTRKLLFFLDTFVLIETLWNVKTHYRRSLQTVAVVLIETLWNVKKIAVAACVCSASVLIETLWNVKTDTLDWFAFLLMGINRNIVECKGRFSNASINIFRPVLIETLWNVKLINSTSQSISVS